MAPTATRPGAGVRDPDRERSAAGDRRRIRHRANDLNPTAWVEFIETEVLERASHGSDHMTARRQPLTDSDTRSVFRWTREGNAPSIWSADQFMVRYCGGGGVNEFFLWCEFEGHNPWARGEPPDWHERNDVYEDLESSDPRWRQEAGRELEQMADQNPSQPASRSGS